MRQRQDSESVKVGLVLDWIYEKEKTALEISVNETEVGRKMKRIRG